MAFDRPETEMRHMAAFREHYPTHCEPGEQLLRLADEGIASVAKQRQSGSRPLQPQPFALHLLFTKGYKALWSVIILRERRLSEDAAILLRALLNLLIVTMWIRLRARRAEWYLQWFWIAAREDVKNSLSPARTHQELLQWHPQS
jgi:hypothetical protein